NIRMSEAKAVGRSWGFDWRGRDVPEGFISVMVAQKRMIKKLPIRNTYKETYEEKKPRTENRRENESERHRYRAKSQKGKRGSRNSPAGFMRDTLRPSLKRWPKGRRVHAACVSPP